MFYEMGNGDFTSTVSMEEEQLIAGQDKHSLLEVQGDLIVRLPTDEHCQVPPQEKCESDQTMNRLLLSDTGGVTTFLTRHGHINPRPPSSTCLPSEEYMLSCSFLLAAVTSSGGPATKREPRCERAGGEEQTGDAWRLKRMASPVPVSYLLSPLSSSTQNLLKSPRKRCGN
ncbi:hypothetical protein EYF80_015142 [Liparis tanakae]|uniref:Uncharacterized protein n=1 Tax=Liparis tanakae TaxID=230148 RepID=A0A4Z2IAZ8_9TELE|nr:hypothetical protein EYF80_015142 [Liparis tanakae]